jgi:hypothetical protein
MHGSQGFARGSCSRATHTLRARVWQRRAVRWLCCFAATVVCHVAGAQPPVYPVTATPLATPSPFGSGRSTEDLKGIPSELAQPSVAQPAVKSDSPSVSVGTASLSQPQFLATEHGVTASGSEGAKVKNDAANDNRDDPANKVSGWARLWKQSAGTNKTATVTGTPAVPLAAKTSGTTTARLSATPPTLMSQLFPLAARQQTAANRTAPPAEPPIEKPKKASFSSSDERYATDVTGPKATAHVDSQRHDVTTSTGYPGLWDQLSGGHSDSTAGNAIASNEIGNQKPAPAQSSQSQTPPEAGTRVGKFLSALAHPITMQSDERSIRRPTVRQTAVSNAATPNAQQEVAESEQIPSLLLPFYQTNDNRPTDQSAGQFSQSRQNIQGPDLEDSVRTSKLMQQLSLSTNSDLRSDPETSADSPLRKAHEPWDGGWTLRAPSELNPFAMTSQPEQPERVLRDGVNVAYLQDTLPTPVDAASEPDKISLPGDENSAEGGQTASGDNQNGEASENSSGKKQDEKLATADKLGEKPEDRSLEFLRAETVLLKPGKYQFDIGFQYIIQERNFPILFRAVDPAHPVDDAHVVTTGGNALSFTTDEARFKSRELEVPMQLRYGLFKRVQVFIGAPLGWSNTEVDLTHFDEFQNDGGIGDIYFGSTIQFQEAEADCPYVIGTGVVTAPSGGDPFTGVTGFAPSAPSLGNGFWKLAGNLLFIQPLDPVTFFYGAGIRGSFAHDYIGATFEPGLEFDYTFGMGFAINEKVTFSTQLFGEYQSNLEVNGQPIHGSAQEPISLQLAATIARPCERYLEPFIQFGMTQDAPSVDLGITWTF